MDVDPKLFTSVQLRDWLRNLNLKSSGTKAEMALRLSEVAPEERGAAPPAVEIEPEEDEESVNASDDGAYAAASESHIELENIERELELIRRERDLLARENKILKKEAGKTAVPVWSTGSAPTGDQSIPFNVVKDMIPEFDGDSNIDFWVAQARSIKNNYKLGEHVMRALIATKLSGKVKNWLHSNVDFATCDVEELFGQMKNVFGTQDNKLLRRRRFEQRKWVPGETFGDYYNDKNALGDGLQIDDDEMVDYLIEGIPNRQLRTQAQIQCFDNKKKLLKAFAKVTLNNEARPTPKLAANANEVRCYNCNALGHYATSCVKPKRQMGACYGCGKMDHQVVSCPERKKPAMVVDYNEYVRVFKYVFKHNDNEFVLLETLIDSGSPISFVRRSSLPKELNINFYNVTESNFFGLNKSSLKTYGNISCILVIAENNFEIHLLVVADESMKYDIVLGRDFLRVSRSKLLLSFENEDYCKMIDNDKSVKENTEEMDKVRNLNDRCEVIDVDRNLYKGIKMIENKSTENVNQLIEIAEEVKTTENYAEFDKCLLTISYDYGNEPNINVDHLKHTHKSKVISMFNETYIRPMRPRDPQIKCEMKITLNSAKPFNFRPRRLAYTEKNKLQNLIDEYLAKGFIRNSESEYASPIVLVKKKSGELRMCVDYRKLNEITAKDNYPLPLIDDLLDRLADKQFFTKLDLKNGFYHVFMSPESIKFTSFVTPLGQFEFLRMPFGLKNAPSTFQRFVNKVFAEMIREDKVIVYMDDIMVATENFENHMVVLKEVFKRMVDNKLELNIDKCEFLMPEIKYLGYIINSKGIKADEKGIQAIRDFPIPKNVKLVQSFLGLCSYFRRFIENFSVIAKPLYDLTKKDAIFKFGTRELECFENLKNKMIKAPLLSIYNPTHETELHCDASKLGFGAILLQRKNDSKIHPVFYFSKRTSEAESKYDSFELETLAIIYALKRFRIYLLGIRFKIVTDCNSLTLTLNKKELNARIARWALELQNYDYFLEHRKNDRMHHVDALSRCNNIMIIEANTFEENLIICQNKDKKIKELQKFLENSECKLYEMKNGVVYRKTRDKTILFYVPEIMENQVIFKFHDEMGHIGIDKTIELISKTYWFPSLRNKVADHISNCLKCIVFSSKPGKEEGFIHIVPKGEKPFEVVHIDHYGPIQSSAQTKYLLVVVDAFTKFVRLYCTKTTKTKEVVNALTDYFRAYSRPNIIVSDRGSCFTSIEFEEFLNENKIRHYKVATGSPQANGQVERINRSIGPMMAKLVNTDQGRSWMSVVKSIEFVLNNTVHRATNQHPSIMLFGTNQKGEMTDPFQETLLNLCKKKTNVDIKHIRKLAAIKQRNLQIYNKKYVDKKRKKPHKYRVGDYVMIKNFDSNVGVCRKLIPKFRGPYIICKVLRNDRYLLKDVDNFQKSQIPYIGVWAVGNIRPSIKNK